MVEVISSVTGGRWT